MPHDLIWVKQMMQDVRQIYGECYISGVIGLDLFLVNESTFEYLFLVIHLFFIHLINHLFVCKFDLCKFVALASPSLGS